jgi:hypothetical protein
MQSVARASARALVGALVVLFFTATLGLFASVSLAHNATHTDNGTGLGNGCNVKSQHVWNGLGNDEWSLTWANSGCTQVFSELNGVSGGAGFSYAWVNFNTASISNSRHWGSNGIGWGACTMTTGVCS